MSLKPNESLRYRSDYPDIDSRILLQEISNLNKRIHELEVALKDIKNHMRIVSPGMYEYSAVYQIANKVLPE